MKLYFKSEVACPLFERGKLERFLESLRIYTGGVLITLGLFMGFFGPTLVSILVFLISSFAIFLILASITYNLFMDLVPSKWVVYVCAGSFFIFSLVIAFFLSRLKQSCCKSKSKNTKPESTDELDDPEPKQNLFTKC